MVQAESDVLLIDEVLAVGDAAFQQKCFDTFHELREQGKTIVLVTHDMDMIERFCHRALLISDARVDIMGEPAAVARRYLDLNFAAEAVDRPAREPGRHRARGRDRRRSGWRTGRGADAATVPQGDPIRIRALIEIHEPSRTRRSGITIHNEDGTVVFEHHHPRARARPRRDRSGGRAGGAVAGRWRTPCSPRATSSTAACTRARTAWPPSAGGPPSFLVYGNRRQGGLVALDHTLELERQPASAIPCRRRRERARPPGSRGPRPSAATCAGWPTCPGSSG